jgi:membrane-bound serine protease (ClpP class)
MFSFHLLRQISMALILLCSQCLLAKGVAIEIRGTINPATSHYLGRAIGFAEKEKFDFVLVELDTPGGLVSSVREMAQAIDQSTVPILVYTSPAGAAATSAGALLMISSHLSAMAPGTNIGAAHPVGAQGEDIKGEMGEKAVNDLSAFARSMAELRGRNVKVAEQVVTKSKSFTADEALNLKFVDLIAKDRSELWSELNNRKIKVGLEEKVLSTQPEPEILQLKMTLGESILHQLSHPNIAAILMSLAIVLIYAELSAPGIGVSGVLGGICLITAFISFQALSVSTGGMILLALGIILFISEIFVVSHGALALGGSISLILGFLWAIDPTETDLRIDPMIIAGISVVTLGSSLLIGYVVSRLKKQSEGALLKVKGGELSGLKEYDGRIVEVDSTGFHGQVEIRGELWNFVADEVMKKNKKVKVTSTNGLTVKVQPMKE